MLKDRDPDRISAEEVGDILNVSRDTVRLYAKAGRVPCKTVHNKVTGRVSYRFSRAAIEKFVERKKR